MVEEIRDGSGNSSKRLRIDDQHRAHVKSASQDITVDAANRDIAHTITSGEINLTSASESAIMYYINNEDADLYVHEVNFDAGVSTAGTTNVCAVKRVINPEGLGSGGGSELSTWNLKNGNDAVAYALTTTNSENGVEAATVTNGTEAEKVYMSDSNSGKIPSSVYILGKGDSVAYTVIPPAANTSIDVSIRLTVSKVEK